MRFINGWFRFGPGGGDEFMAVMRPMLPVINSMPGVFYLEMAPRDGDPDVIVVVEAFEDDAAHAAMWATPEFEVVKATLDRLSPSSRFDVHHAEAVKTEFWGRAAPSVGSDRLPKQADAA